MKFFSRAGCIRDERGDTGSVTALHAPPTTPVLVLETGVRWSRRVALAGLGTAGVLAVLSAGLADRAVLALAAAGLLAGLPHGSIDHLVAARLTRLPTAVVAAAYALAAATAWVLMVWLGTAAIVVVLGVSVAHFAAGEVEVVRETTGWRPSRPVLVALGVAGTGALLLPLARSGPLVSQVARGVSPQLATLIGSPGVRVALVVLWLVAAAVAGLAAVRDHQSSVLLDLALVGALGALAPPLLAFALWFGGWHGLRHCARLLGEDERCAALVRRGRAGEAVRELARLAAWPTLAATATLALLVTVTATAPDVTRATSSTLLVLLALTVPHVLVVGWCDRRGPALLPAPLSAPPPAP